MRAKEFILEDKITHIAGMLNDKITQRYADDTGNSSSAIEIVKQLSIASIKNLQWVVNRYIRREFKLEDIPQIKQELIKFQKYKSKIPAEDRDLNSLSLPALYDVLEKLDPEEPVSNRAKDKQVKNEFFTNGDAIIIYKDSELTIVNPKTEAASCFFGKNTKWCTASAYGGDNYFDSYNADGPLYIIMTKAHGKFQFQFESNSYMDARDQELSSSDFDDLLKAYPKLYDVFAKQTKEFNVIPLMQNPSEEDLQQAIMSNPTSIKFLDDPTEEQQMAAVADRAGGHNIRYIKNPTPAVQIASVKDDRNNFKLIKNPADEVKAHFRAGGI